MIRILVCVVAFAVALQLSGCAGGSLGESEQQAMAQAATAAPKVQPGDKIRVVVFGEDKLSGDYEISQSGEISLPLAGTVDAKGLTQAELEQTLAKTRDAGASFNSSGRTSSESSARTSLSDDSRSFLRNSLSCSLYGKAAAMIA